MNGIGEGAAEGSVSTESDARRRPSYRLDETTPPPGVRLPRQPRSRASFERIIAAAHDLIAEVGLEGATVQGILLRSGVGSGTFYARFDGRDALLAYLAIRFRSDAEEGWAGVLSPRRWEAAGPREIVTQFTRMAVVWMHAHGALLRAFLVHAMTYEGYDLLDQTAELDNTVADHLIQVLLPRGGGVHPRRAGAGHPTRHASGVRHAPEPIHLLLGRAPRRHRRPAPCERARLDFSALFGEQVRRRRLVAGPLAVHGPPAHPVQSLDFLPTQLRTHVRNLREGPKPAAPSELRTIAPSAPNPTPSPCISRSDRRLTRPSSVSTRRPPSATSKNSRLS